MNDDIDNELSAMGAIVRALDDLEDDDARRRVLEWTSSRYEQILN